MTWKDSNRYKRILREAEIGHYGVIAVIAYNIEQIVGFVRAAETARSPLILQLFPWAIEVTDGLLVRAAAKAAKRASVPISVHLDHAQSEAIIKHAAELPFDSIMVDMSHYDKETNLKKTRELVQYCNEREKATEAEPGRIEGGEDGVMDTAGLEACLTTSEEVDEFINTGVDVLAPRLWQCPRFEMVRARANGRVNLAIHGTNGFAPELIKRCVVAGVTKINVNRLVLDDYYDHLRENVGKMSHTQLIEEGIQKVTDLTIRWMEICGSAGKA
ncbi:hypothetical protein N7524_011473 [Penicillium chrysogenum]|nr:hypothetical protein N7524_011473 [Penicillium chrysogenum]